MAADGVAGERWLLFGLTAAWALVVVNNLMVGPLLVELSRDFGMSVPEIAVVVSAYGLTAGVAALAAGPLLDRFGRIELALGGLAVLGGSAAIAAQASGLGMLLVARVAAGLGVAFLQPGVFALVGDAIPYHRRGRAMGLVMNGSSFASLAGVPAVTFAAGAWGWRSAFGLALGLGAVTGMLMLAGLRAVPGRGTRAEAAGSLGVGATYRLVLANPSAVWAVVVNFLGSAYWFGWLTYLAAFFVYRFELSTVAIAPLISATGIGMLIGVNLGGRFGDAVGHRRLTAYAHVVSAVMLAPPHHYGSLVVARRRHRRRARHPHGRAIRDPKHAPLSTRPRRTWHVDGARRGRNPVRAARRRVARRRHRRERRVQRDWARLREPRPRRRRHPLVAGQRPSPLVGRRSAGRELACKLTRSRW
ncbi:MAG: MFS transporter [Chloroflexi bacterium]|nr:MFS transporter [Chloroflexota bacterium]